MSFKSILSGIAHVLEKVFTPGNIRIAASIAELALPGFAPLIIATTDAIIDTENAAIAAGKQSGTGTQKAALVISRIEAQYTQFATANGIPVIPSAMQKYVDAAVAMLNSFPAPGSTQLNPLPTEPVVTAQNSVQTVTP